MNSRLRTVKTILWALAGVWLVLTAARFINGLGATTNLSDATPWGFWIAFDVMSGVALAAGGFVIAATVYIFGLERYRPFVRPAILTAFLGYVAVAIGLLYDLGLPWNIWHPMIFPQHHSVLFEVAMCVMLYLTVLALEFAPAALEHPLFGHPLLRWFPSELALKILKRFTIVLVIAGIVLSTLHQSSLGSLFLIAPHRLHVLWYSPIIYLLFFISAIGLGLMTVIMECLVSGWLFGHRIRPNLLSGLGLAGSIVLAAYAIARLGDLAIRGAIGGIFESSSQSGLFVFEILVSAIIPASLLAFRRIRGSVAGLAVCSAMAIFGIVLNRFSVCILAFDRPANMSYFPSWPELGVSIGIVAAASLVFLFFAENLKIYGHEDAPESAASSADGSRFNPASVASMMPESIAAPRRYSLAVIVAAGLTVGFLPREAMFGLQPPVTPVAPVRAITGAVQSGNGDGNGPYVLASLSATAAPNENLTSLMLIDGNRDGQFVLFAHSGHVKALGEEKSCGACHHMNMPFDQNSSCSECHRDMYEPTDIFDHSSHLAHLNGNQGCVKCHADSSQPKSRATSTACGECHADMAVEGSFVPNKGPFMDEPAASYMNAMHGLCVKCHEEKVEQDPGQFQPAFAQCASCHETALMFDLREQGPYAQMPDGNGGGEKALADSISGHSAR